MSCPSVDVEQGRQVGEDHQPRDVVAPSFLEHAVDDVVEALEAGALAPEGRGQVHGVRERLRRCASGVLGEVTRSRGSPGSAGRPTSLRLQASSWNSVLVAS